MEKIGDAATAEAKVVRDVQGLVAKVKRLAAQDVKDADYGIALLTLLRAEIGEDLNQIQHEYLILRGVRWLVADRCGSSLEWNPRQTGSGNEPDLRGRGTAGLWYRRKRRHRRIRSERFDGRMKKTLAKLSQMEGIKFYFICTEPMEKRAKFKVASNGWAIKVVHV
jgi:hypothetical protein